MNNIKLGYIHVPIHSYIHHSNKTNTVQETREPIEITEEEKNIAKGFSIGIIVIFIISTIALAIAMHKFMKTY